ncbi:MAG TPA: two-component regulator propeller domain-containing protein, partial [Chitinophagaceae bacterium]
MRKYFQLVLLSIFFMHDLHAQENVFVFSHLKEKEGLSYNVVNCFLKDSRGIFWIGTQNGLNRFDGSNFYSFKVSRSGNSIPDGEIMSLCEDKKGNIWGGTANGIFCYSPGKNKFITYFPLDSKLGNSFLNILCDKQGNIWAGGWITLLKFIPASNSFREIIRLSGIDSARQFSMRQNCMLEDPSGNGLWMATRTGMFYYDSKKDQLISNVNQPGNPLFTRNNVSALSRSQGGHFWCFDNATKEIIAFDPQLKKILFGINVGKNMPAAVGATLFEDKQNRIWFSSWSSEMIVVDYLKNKEVTQIRHSNDFSSSIAHTFCWAIDQDEDGTIWFGSLSGISRCNPEKSIYTLYGLPEKIDLFKKNRNISLIKEDPSDNSLWILSDDKNLIHYFKEQKRYEVFDLTKARPGADGRVLDAIYAIRFYNEGVILCSNFGNWYKPAAKKQFEPFSLFPPGYPDFASVYYVSSGDTVFYYSNIKNVLYWNRLTGKTKLIGFDIDTLPNGSVPIAGSMVLDTHNKLWVYCSAGWVSELRGDTLHPVLISKNEKGESVGYFNSMEADNAGNIWLSNQLTGLYRYNTKSGQIENWDESDGLSVYGANRVLIGNKGQVWMPNGTRVSVLAPDVNTIYDFSLPLEDNTVGYYNSIENLHNGNILLSVYNELVEFKPQQLNIVPAKRKPQISLVNVSGKDYIVNGNSK